MRLLALALLATLLAGCATRPGVRWYAPGTWFSAAPAGAVDRAEVKQEAARHAVVAAAQRSAHSTALALAAAPASRPVEVATESNSTTVALLDQAAGPLEAAEAARLRAQVAGLLSENASLRARAEAERAAEAGTVARVSAELARAEAESEAAQARLRTAFDRENALANELRSQRALLWIAGGVALLLAAGWLYVRFALGGVPVAIGRGLAALRAQHPEAANLVTQIFDSHLNRHEQARIAQHAR